ncbi:MAG TPA: DUF4352 domain-containing protein, partial [Candidatus Pacearchaeota archaeon]|nr:DUF4352 domain-containing protein [Candidatus Pacearchaeota archaeon]
SSWSECGASGIQTRICTDSNNCGTLKNKPSETQTCTYQYKLGDKVVIGDFSYVFNSKEETSEIGDYILDSFFGEKADGVFYIIDLTIENQGTESKNFDSDLIKIVDSQNRKFSSDSSAGIYLDDDAFFYDQLQPGLPKRGKIVFDVPNNLEGKIEISSNELFSNEIKYVLLE